MQNENSSVHKKSEIRHCCCCLSPRIEVIIWACISLSSTACMVIIMFLGIIFVDSASGYHFSAFDEIKLLILFSSALLTDIVYNMFVVVASLGKKVKLLKISLYFGAIMCVILCAVTALSYEPSGLLHLFEGLRYILTVFVVIIVVIRCYMLLIIRGVMMNLRVQDRKQFGYIDLQETMEKKNQQTSNLKP
ncbi:uncharacterized protein LOC125235447 [Leguminivora glycinivorella]|uniref:uncharacterized protein LOC125235447 n=1 Tax=Leguminivora glycinivorella TaxID=1035111 RepID=UPI00200EDF5F|nr:uncharacterized protein LOC125235447 [Leguminivora glycinivorella]